jgi:hypothetical protein
MERKLHRAFGVIPGRWQIGKADLPASPESITPGGAVGPTSVHNPTEGDYGLRGPLAELVLGRRVAPIRVLAASE